MITAATIRVPDSLAELNQWIVWRYEQRDGGKPTKVPYQMDGTGPAARIPARGQRSRRR